MSYLNSTTGYTSSYDNSSFMDLASDDAIHSRGSENDGYPSIAGNPALTGYAGQIGDRMYLLQILQQPVVGAEHGSYALSRLPLSPPLILQLVVFNYKGVQITIDDELPFFVSHLQLLTEYSVSIQEPPSDSPSATSSQRLLYGSLVANVQSFIDPQGHRGYFLLFPDVSLRVCGRYRLGIGLTRLQTDASNMHMVGGSTGCLAQVVTDTFEVVQQSQYTAAPVTTLSTHLQQQGAWIVRRH